ncbi:hypothetical protein [Salisediminibacterium halotolerans]|nr:hypothetical protein [Salisediminibacterium haloalkalitolerans]
MEDAEIFDPGIQIKGDPFNIRADCFDIEVNGVNNQDNCFDIKADGFDI